MDIFTFKEQTEKTHTLADAYAQAAMVIRERYSQRYPHRPEPVNQSVFHPWTYDSVSAKKTRLTLKELSEQVERITAWR